MTNNSVFFLFSPHQDRPTRKMCYGQPYYAECQQHMLIEWQYCPESDLDTVLTGRGYKAPCSISIYARPQPSHAKCPVEHCQTKAPEEAAVGPAVDGAARAPTPPCTASSKRTDITSGGPHGSKTPEGVEPSNSWQTRGHGRYEPCNTDCKKPLSTPFCNVCRINLDCFSFCFLASSPGATSTAFSFLSFFF